MRAIERRRDEETKRRSACDHTLASSRRPTLATSHSSRRAARGFTLVEMVVVIGIIVLLVSLTIAVMTALTRGSETRTTENMLTLLDTAYQEWKSAAERDVSYGVAGQPQAGVVYEIVQDVTPLDADDHELTDQLIGIINKTASVRTLLANISSDLLKKHAPPDTDTTVVDAWDGEIVTVFPGRTWVNGDTYTKDSGGDGSIQTEFENVYGRCVNRRIRFISAGPDGQFGDLTAASGTPAYEQTKDNVYSYPLEAP